MNIGIETDKKVEELPPFKTLEEYAELMGDEYGEALERLLNLQRRTMYLGEKIKKAVDEEVERQLKHCQENARVIKTTTTVTYNNRTEMELDWD